jgi:hypothetical protein
MAFSVRKWARRLKK